MANSSVFVVHVRTFLQVLRVSQRDTFRGTREECKAAELQKDQSDCDLGDFSEEVVPSAGQVPGRGKKEGQSFELQLVREGHKGGAEWIPARGHRHHVSLGSTLVT